MSNQTLLLIVVFIFCPTCRADLGARTARKPMGRAANMARNAPIEIIAKQALSRVIRRR
jgi:hypothetical protein